MNQPIRNDIVVAIHPFECLSIGDGADAMIRSLQLEFITGLSRFRQFTLLCGDTGTQNDKPADYVIKCSAFVEHNSKISLQVLDGRQRLVFAQQFSTGKSLLEEYTINLLVSAVTQQLDLDLLARLRRNELSSPGAYGHWLFGMEELKKGTLEADEKAREHFARAMDCDASFSLAYSGMSLTFFNEWSCQAWDRWDVSHKGAYTWARKAFDLDQQNCVAALVLGRVYLYEADFEKATYYLREALRLNSTDVDNLMQIATCLVFQGELADAEKLYEQAVALNPIGANQYYHIASFISLEKGDDDKAIDFGLMSTFPWVDFYAMLAAAYFFKGNQQEMQRWWEIFLEQFRVKINKGAAVTSHEALQWLINISPYRRKPRQQQFWQFILGTTTPLQPRVFARAAGEDTVSSFFKEGDLWKLEYHGTAVFITDSKGLNDIRRLIASPDQDIHCVELLGTELIQERASAFDERARRNYQRRISELQVDIATAQDNNDTALLPSLQEEYDAIMSHVAQALDHKGRVRRINDNQDKARSAVTWRIRSAIQKIEAVHPRLGKHLSAAIRTGFYCSYAPETPHRWAT